MRAFLEDKSGRGADACDLMTGAVRTNAGAGDPSVCPARTLLAGAALGTKRLTDLEAKVANLPITITGDHATAPDVIGSAAGTTFVYSGGRWLIGDSP